ncbi:hypothetical protein fugu_017115 [Takifugu bimaculatus]|uniref:Uncharacterized protein n=1 Tax=Takifugu bimaculatus TaxID=433685 RepID=A0A4Z2BVL4_9TELE|nr:hypothetical protein fugu_017115 [Takifugu bimaculatus]
MCEELRSSWHQDRGPEQGVQVPPPHVSFTSVTKRQTCLLALTSVFFMLPIEFRNTNTGLDKYKHMQVQNAPTCTGIFTSDLLGGFFGCHKLQLCSQTENSGSCFTAAERSDQLCRMSSQFCFDVLKLKLYSHVCGPHRYTPPNLYCSYSDVGPGLAGITT